MPILNADEAKQVVFLKRSMRPGFAGIENELLFEPDDHAAVRRRQGHPGQGAHRRQGALTRGGLARGQVYPGTRVNLTIVAEAMPDMVRGWPRSGGVVVHQPSTGVVLACTFPRCGWARFPRADVAEASGHVDELERATWPATHAAQAVAHRWLERPGHCAHGRVEAVGPHQTRRLRRSRGLACSDRCRQTRAEGQGGTPAEQDEAGCLAQLGNALLRRSHVGSRPGSCPRHANRRQGRQVRSRRATASWSDRDGDVVERHGVSVMSATRVGLEVTTIVPTEAALVAVNHLLHAGHTTVEAMQERLRKGDRVLEGDARHRPRVATRRCRRRIRGRVALLLLLLRPRATSADPAIRGVRRRWSVHRQGRLRLARARHLRRVRREGEVREIVEAGRISVRRRVREKRREERIVEVTGWMCIRVTWPT